MGPWAFPRLKLTNSAPAVAMFSPKKNATRKFFQPFVLQVTWRIILVSKWLVTPMYKPFSSFGRGITRSLGDLQSPWLLTTYKSWDDPPSTG